MYLKFLYFIYFKIFLLHMCISEITSFRPACCTIQFVSDHGRNPKDSFLMPHMRHFVRKQVFCTHENKDADQLRGIRYTNSTIPLLYKSETPSIKTYFVALKPGLCRTWSETPMTRFLTTRLIL